MRSFTQKLVLLVGLSGLALAYQNCGSKHAMTPDELASLAADSASRTPDSSLPDGGVGPTTVKPGEINAKLQLGNQLMKSLSALTGVPFTTAAVVTEYNLRAPVMAGSFDPQAVTSPLMIAVTDLASVYCNTIITTEQAQAAAARRLFGALDFNAAMSAASYDTMVKNLAQKFYARDLSPAELSTMQTNNTAFQTGFAANVAAGTRTRTTALYACTAMLSVFDVLTF